MIEYTRTGEVILVGAGPGSAGLLTLRGKEALESAQVVLYDRLVGPEILAMIPENAEKVDVGKRAGKHTIPQSETNAMLIRYASEGKRVIRLKGGDPYLFGRGAEELEALADAGIPFEAVPGVTSALAVPAFAGIPVSHREHASSVHVISAHRKGGAAPSIDYRALAQLGGTLVFLMGVETLEALTAGLSDAGLAKVPAALIENGTRPNQRRLCASVADIAEKARICGYASPCVLVVGGVVTLANKLDWFTVKPLHSAKIAVTRPKSGGELSWRLRELGANVVELPCINMQNITVPDSVFANISSYDWLIFTSPTGVERFFYEMRVRRIDIRETFGVKIASVGAKTAAAVESHGIMVEYIPQDYNAKALAEGLPLLSKKSLSSENQLSSRYKLFERPRVLLFRAKGGDPALPEILIERGFSVDDVFSYESVTNDTKRADIMLDDIKYITFTSASTVQGFVSQHPTAEKSALTAVCIGESTASAARSHGFKVVTSVEATIESMVQCIINIIEKEHK